MKNPNLTSEEMDNPNIDNKGDAGFMNTKIVTTHESRSDAIAKFRDGHDINTSMRDWLKLYCADYKIMGYSGADIQKFMERDFGRTLHYVTIMRYIKQVITKWEDSMEKSISKRKTLELAKIDRLESTYWEAWYESKEDKNGITIETDEHPIEGGGEGDMELKLRRKKVRENKYSGDGQFLKGIEWCIEMRCKIFGVTKEGLDVSISSNPVDKGKLDVEQLDKETIRKMIGAFSQSQLVKDSKAPEQKEVVEAAVKKEGEIRNDVPLSCDSNPGGRDNIKFEFEPRGKKGR